MFECAASDFYEVSFLVSDQYSKIRLDVFLSRMLQKNLGEKSATLLKGTPPLSGSFSREKIKQLIKDGMVILNGVSPVSPKTLLKVKDIVIFRYISEQTKLKAEEGELDILYKDPSLIVLNKPSGLTVHPAPSTPGGVYGGGTLANRLLANFPELNSFDGFRPGIVHRLDKDTSGAMLVALSERARLRLSQNFADRDIHKEYLALVYGVPKKKEGIVEAPIGRHPKHKTKMAVVDGGREAKSSWKVLYADPLGKYSLLSVKIYTGRTHQVRVHMVYIGHPLLGDAVYANEVCKNSQLNEWNSSTVEKKEPIATRQMLHAWKLQFLHPFPEDIVTPSDAFKKVGGISKSSNQVLNNSTHEYTWHKLRFPDEKNMLFPLLKIEKNKFYVHCTPPEDFIQTVRSLAQHTLRIVITGMPGCGKSTLLRFFESNGLPIFSADTVIKNLYEKGADGWHLLYSRYGDRFIDPKSGEINKKLLGDTMRERQSLRKEIEQLLHPLVFGRLHDFWKHCSMEGQPLGVAEIPLFFESLSDKCLRMKNSIFLNTEEMVVIGVHCPFHVRYKRLVKNRGWSGEIIDTMESWQWPEDKKMESCDVVIPNVSSEEEFLVSSKALLHQLYSLRALRIEAISNLIQSKWL